MLAVKVGHDGTVYSGSFDSTIRLWSGVDGSHLETLQVTPKAVRCLATGTHRLISGFSDHTIAVWTREFGMGRTSSALEHTLIGHTGEVWSICLNANQDKVLSASDDKTVRMWSAGDGSLVAILKGHTSSVYAIIVTKTGMIISASQDSTVRVWSEFDGRFLRTLRHHRKPVVSLTLGPDNEVFSSSKDRTLARVCSVTGRCLGKVKCDDVIDEMALGADGKIYGVFESNEIHVW